MLLDTSTLKYQWTQSAAIPEESTFTESFTNASEITKTEGENGWYLWILAKDYAGNTVIDGSNVFNLDNNHLSITESLSYSNAYFVASN